jgi:hypothetical protein
VNEGLLGLREHLVVTAHAAVATEPREGALDHPAAGKYFKAGARRRLTTGRDPGPGGTPLGNLDGEAQLVFGIRFEAATIALIDPQVSESREAFSDSSQELLPTLAIVDVRGMDPHCQHEAERVYQQVPLPSVDPLGAVIAADPPFSVVRTDWLSMIPALGVRSRPACPRTSSRRASCIRSQVPSILHTRK